MRPPLLRVSRPVAACARCRSAKIKCDGKLPACTSCIRSNRAFECSNSNDQFSRGKERSYVAALESKIEKLERQVAETRRNQYTYAVAAAHAAAVATSKISDRPDALSSILLDNLDINLPSDRHSNTHKEASRIDDLVSGFGLLAVNATARDFDGVLESLSYAKVILTASMRNDMSKIALSPLPPRHATLGRAQFYLNTIFILLPFMEETGVYASIDAVYDKASVSSPFDRFTVRIILAVSSASMSEKRGDAHYAEGLGHARAALEFAEDLLHPGSLQCIQALLLLAEYASFEPTYFDNWTLIGAASRVMIDLGLHQDPSRVARSNMSRDQLELRRRVFYSVYSLDRSISPLMGCAFSFSDDSCSVAIPFASDVTVQPSSSILSDSSSPPGDPMQQLSIKQYDTARDFFRLRQIQSKYYTELHQTSRTPMEFPYRYIWRSYHDMSAWYASLAVNPNQEVVRYFSTELLYGYISLLAPSPRCPTPSLFASRLLFEHCIAFIDCMDDVHHFDNLDPRGYRTAVISQALIRLHKAARLLVDIVSNHSPDLFENYPASSLGPNTSNSRKKKASPPVTAPDHDPTVSLGDIAAPDIPTPTAFYALLHLRHPSASQSPPPSDHFPSAVSDPVTTDDVDHYSTRTLNSILKATHMLQLYGKKFDIMVFHSSFVQMTSPILDSLRNIEASYTSSLNDPTAPTSAVETPDVKATSLALPNSKPSSPTYIFSTPSSVPTTLRPQLQSLPSSQSIPPSIVSSSPVGSRNYSYSTSVAASNSALPHTQNSSITQHFVPPSSSPHGAFSVEGGQQSSLGNYPVSVSYGANGTTYTTSHLNHSHPPPMSLNQMHPPPPPSSLHNSSPFMQGSGPFPTHFPNGVPVNSVPPSMQHTISPAQSGLQHPSHISSGQQSQSFTSSTPSIRMNHYQMSPVASHPPQEPSPNLRETHPSNYRPVDLNHSWDPSQDVHHQQFQSSAMASHLHFHGQMQAPSVGPSLSTVSVNGMPQIPHTAISVPITPISTDVWNSWPSPLNTGISTGFGGMQFQASLPHSEVSSHPQSFSHSLSPPQGVPMSHYQDGGQIGQDDGFMDPYQTGLLMPWEAIPNEIENGFDDYENIEFVG